jgi:hypothetical protein
VAFQIVLTKADDTKPAQLARRREEAEAPGPLHTAGHPLVLATSAETEEGIPSFARDGGPGAAGGLIQRRVDPPDPAS